MIYEHYFALNQRPFSIAPNPGFLFACGQYEEALAALEYGMLHRGGFVLLTGEVGTGKTTLCKYLLQSVPQDTEVALILHPQLDRLELLQLICKEFGVETVGLDKESQLIERLTEFLLEVYSKGGYSVLIIDEAQHLDESVLELIRLLTNLETHEDKLLQIILLGQPELMQRLNRYELRQLNQRFTARYHLNGLSLLQTQAYINHRIEVAGGKGDLFDFAAVWYLHRLTKGIPRLINVLADRCLMGCYAEQKSSVNLLMVRRAAKEVLPQVKAKKSFIKPTLATTVLAVLGFLVWPYVKTLSVMEAVNVETQQAVQNVKSQSRSPSCVLADGCWLGRLPSSVIESSNMHGDVLLNGRWQSYQGQFLANKTMIDVTVEQVDPRFLTALIKPFDEDALIPWVRSALQQSSESLSNDEDYSQWQVIKPTSIQQTSSQTYDVMLHDAVMAFQRKHQLLVDGILGPQTLISLYLWDQKMQMAAQ
ncbi:MAG: AAA family ATPase [Gammaproteobacteria bacterium]|nr:AAA family ATPase [Gammaproteobacteria bacterium]